MGSENMNDIPTRQNDDAYLRYLKAARSFYSDGKRLLGIQMTLTIGVPITGVLIGLLTADPTVKAIVAALSLTIAILDASVFDRALKKTVAKGARAQEKFDCELMGMSWDGFTVGAALDPEDIHQAAKRYSFKHSDASIRDWYPPIVGTVPLHYARIVCQRTNLWYDSTLRQYYGRTVLGLAIGAFVALLVVSLVGQISLADFVLVVLAPASPLLGWSVREFFRQRDTVLGQNEVRKHADALWSRVKTTGCDVAECDTQSRQFQDAIFSRRSTGPLIFDWVYSLRRPGLEDHMIAGAEQLIAELRAAGRLA
jgi:hypothetical protein